MYLLMYQGLLLPRPISSDRIFQVSLINKIESHHDNFHGHFDNKDDRNRKKECFQCLLLILIFQGRCIKCKQQRIQSNHVINKPFKIWVLYHFFQKESEAIVMSEYEQRPASFVYFDSFLLFLLRCWNWARSKWFDFHCVWLILWVEICLWWFRRLWSRLCFLWVWELVGLVLVVTRVSGIAMSSFEFSFCFWILNRSAIAIWVFWLLRPDLFLANLLVLSFFKSFLLFELLCIHVGKLL